MVSGIAQAIRLSFEATSKHVQVLRAVNFVESEQVSFEHWCSFPSFHQRSDRVIQSLMTVPRDT